MKLFLVALLFNVSSAFHTLPMQARRATQLKAQLMNEMDTMCIMNAAKYCVDEECSLEEKEALVNRLEEQSHVIEQRLEDLRSDLISMVPRPKAAALFEQPHGTLMSDVDLLCIENAARACDVAYECDLDDREAFVNRVAEQSSLLNHRFHEMVRLTHSLQTSKHDVDHDDVASLMDSIRTALSMDFEWNPTVAEERIVAGH